MATVTDEYGDAVTEATGEYLSAVRSCVSVLPASLLAYGEDGFEERVDRLAGRESTCDVRLRELRSLLGEARPNYTEVYLRTAEVMELYAAVDAVPDAAEVFLRELSAVDPDLRPATVDDLAAMAGYTSRATILLADVVERFVGSLVSPGTGAPVADAVDQIDDLERQCDALRHDVVERALADRPTPEAILVRDLAERLDEAANAAEDAADHLLFVASGARVDGGA